MLRVLCIAAVAAGALLSGASAAATGPGGPAAVRVTACDPSLVAAERRATFEARARAVPGTARMQLRFALQSRPDGRSPWQTVPAPGFDAWLRSRPGVGRYAYARTVQNLAAPAQYRTVVRFRWLAADGAVLARTRRVSPPCRQPDLRPDLVLRRLRLVPAQEGTRYVAEVRNRGHAPAPAFAVALDPGTGVPVTQPVDGLAPGERRVVAVLAPACAAGTEVRMTADPDGRVDERAEDDNIIVRPCPALPPSRSTLESP